MWPEGSNIACLFSKIKKLYKMVQLIMIDVILHDLNILPESLQIKKDPTI